MQPRHAGAALVSALLLLVSAACSDDDGEPASTEPTTTADEPANTEPANTEPPTTEPSPSSDPPAEDGIQRFPDVIDAVATPSDDGTWRFDVTISSPYDTPERYADAWRIVDDEGAVLGIRELAHDHQNEQPFTRSLSGVVIPGGLVSVTVQGRDQEYGWGGEVVVVALDQQ